MRSVVWVVAFLVASLTVNRAWGGGAALPVLFEASAQALPQAEIRVAIATELGREARPGGAESDIEAGNEERVVVAVDELGQLWVRYWGPRGHVDRHLPMPARPDQIPVVVSLSVGNLVRQEAFEVLRELQRHSERRAESSPKDPGPVTSEPADAGARARNPVRAPTLAPQPVLPRTRARIARARAQRRNSWGHYLVADVPYLPGATRACSTSGQDQCFDASSERTFIEAEGVGRQGGIAPAHARYVMAYSRALTPDLWATLRLGFAFSGGRAKNDAADSAGVSPFMPWLLEVRLQHFPARGAFGGALRPFWYAAAGVSETVAELSLRAPASSDGEPFEPTAESHSVTLIEAMGLLFAGGGAGGSLALFEPLRLELELAGVVAFPSLGWLLRPGVGLSYDF